jgi:hypothetical protein
MRPVIDDTDILEHPSHALQSDACHEPFRQERSPVLAFLRHLFPPVPRLQPRRQACCVPGAPRFETPLDILAREHPDVHLRVMAGLG